MLLPSGLPLVAAPMAGGATTLALAEAVSGAGAFSFLAAGYLSAERLDGEIRMAADLPAFGVNLFVPGTEPAGAAARARAASVAAYGRSIADEAAELGVALGDAVWEDDDFAAKVEVVADAAPAAVSFVFGLPSAAVVSRLRRRGSVVLATVTSAGEARQAEERGVDGLIVQGPRAGGHSALFDPHSAVRDTSTPDAVGEVVSAVRCPVIGAGGVGTAADVVAIVAAGAEAVAVGTALLLADEAGTNATHRAALCSPASVGTVITRAFTGRPARALRTRFTDAYSDLAPVAYPEVHHLTRPMRQAAAKASDPARLHLWAGTGFRHARTEPAASTLTRLVRDL